MKIRKIEVSSNESGREDVHGQAVLLPLTGKAHDPEFIKMYEDSRISRPKTDGKRVYWEI